MSLWTAVKEFFLNVEDSWSARDKAGGQPAAPSGSGIVGAEREPDGPDLQLRLLDLASFKNYLGDEWPKQSAKVMNLANRILDHRLGTREFSTPVGESALLLGLRAFSEDAASLRASFLRDEVTRTLFGSEGLDEHVAKGVGATLRMVTADALGPSTNAEALSSTSYFGPKLTERLLSTDAVSDISRDTDSMLLAVADRAEREITQMDKLITAGGDVHAQGDVVSAVLDNLRTVEASLNDAESAQTDAAAESGPAWRGTTASVRDLISKLAMDAEDRLTALPPRPSAPDLQAATAEARPGLAELKSGEISSEFHYTPMWYVPSGALGMYRMRMSIRIGFEQATSDTLAQFSEDQDLIAVTDRLLFKRSMDDLAYAISIGRASAVCVPVNYLTLNWPRAQRLLLDQCKQLTPSMRRLIVWVRAAVQN